MFKTILLSFLLLFILFCNDLHSQSLTQRERQPVIQGHAQGSTSGSDASQAISNQRKSKGAPFLRFEWLFGPSPVTKAVRVSQSERIDHNYGYMPPRSNSIDPGFFPRRAKVKYTANASFVKNVPSRPLSPSIREEHLTIGTWELGILLGTSHSITDIQNNKSLGFGDFISNQTSNLNFGFGGFARYKAATWFSVSGGIKYARFSGTNEPPVDFEFEAFSFENSLYEFFIKTEFYAPFLEYSPSDIYLFSGVTVFLSDVSLKDADDQSHAITDDFEQIQPAMPFGLGYSYTVYNSVKVGYEFGWRYTLFHYLDGVKVDDRNYDSYFFNMITISYPLPIL